VLLFNATCVHASFGDLELAQIPLKDGQSPSPSAQPSLQLLHAPRNSLCCAIRVFSLAC
jgi:hypothetical protein